MEEKFVEIKETLKKNGGVYTFRMEDLREAIGAGRLGVYVIDSITEKLKDEGLGHYPINLKDSNNQNDPVRLYLLGSQIAKLVDSVININISSSDRYLREQVSSTIREELKQKNSVLDQIKLLVCE